MSVRAARRFALLLVGTMVAVSGCGGCGRTQRSDATHGSIQIPVESDGRVTKVLDAALLDAIPPDFSDGDRRAWRLETLLGDAATRSAIEVEDADGARVIFPPNDPEGRRPVLMVNRSGEPRIALARPDNPFPAFHGRGGNRGRGGDPTRLREVRRIRMIAADAG